MNNLIIGRGNNRLVHDTRQQWRCSLSNRDSFLIRFNKNVQSCRSPSLFDVPINVLYIDIYFS